LNWRAKGKTACRDARISALESFVYESGVGLQVEELFELSLEELE
jgi:hypothetical protein